MGFGPSEPLRNDRFSRNRGGSHRDGGSESRILPNRGRRQPGEGQWHADQGPGHPPIRPVQERGFGSPGGNRCVGSHPIPERQLQLPAFMASLRQFLRQLRRGGGIRPRRDADFLPRCGS